MSVEVIDHTLQGKERLLDVFKDKPNILKILEVYLDPHRELEELYLTLSRPYDLTSENDSVLDNIGSIIGEERYGKDNEAYRKAISFRIGINNSDCSRPYLLGILKDYTESTVVDAHTHRKKSIVYSYNGDKPESDLLMEMSLASPIVSNISIIHNKDTKGLIPCEVGETTLSSVLPEIGDTTGYLPMEIVQEDIASPPIPLYKLRDYFSVNSFIGNGVGRDIISPVDTTSGVGYIISSWVFNPSNEYTRVAFNYGNVSESRIAFNTGSPTDTESVQDYNTTGISVGSSQEWNKLASTFSTIMTKQDPTSTFCKKVYYTGDGTARLRVEHGLSKDPCKILVQPTVGSNQPIIWFKGMDKSKYFYNNGIKTDISIWGDELPTNTYISVGHTSSVPSVNELGVDYEALCFVDNEDFGVTSGSYVATGNFGQAIPKNIPTGLLIICGGVEMAFYDYKSGLQGYLTGNGTLGDSTYLMDIGTNGDFVLGSANSVTNNTGATHYWFCIANPEIHNT